MKKGLVQFGGLYGDTQSVVFPNFLHHEMLETRSKIYDWEIKEHLHTELFQVFFIDEGNGILISGENELKIEGPSIILIPANTVHGFVFQPKVIGEVITFSESFLENIFKNSPKILMETMQLKILNFGKENSTFDPIIQYRKQILNELIDENPEKRNVIQLLFQLLFIQIYRFSILEKQEISVSDNRMLNYFKAFQKNIKQTITETKSVEAYAKELNITAVHLNRICQAIVKKSALQIIHEYLIAEAKKYLLNTHYSISEVSYFLNFKDPAYFTRLFKKQTGVSPSEFKKI
ncbi:transcriptional regulator, AraC family [Emticicia oligotrophica DSM 17448]|uniref:Transcriptional regulator, AraC family n=1 Tax=Emticicia oligotrophica (strain DSM 17448 / CIP 109782 / MTCC 6937 / GPTSA100-15) TaxID=929562 RepID=A0ABM5MZX0_EMTOG|nr:helix-turn-helix domain-containing protein [Emticicia oligotrophica]AFK02728.1 transcriptional regulator, AraC family [Emticicia oligotrophica DSM 17448]